MKIVTLFFACVALFNCAKVGAMDTMNPHPDIGPWTNHAHNHPTEIRRPVPGHPDRPRKQIQIAKVVNGATTNYHLLQGELVRDENIELCNSPHGYAIVDLVKTKRLYACLKPYLKYNETANRERAHDPDVYLAFVIREGQRQLEADLTPRGQRDTLDARGGVLYHGAFFRSVYRLPPQGIVRYRQPNGNEVEGNLYAYPGLRPQI